MLEVIETLKIIKKLHSDLLSDVQGDLDKGRTNIYGGSSGIALFLSLLSSYETNVKTKESILEEITEQVSFSINNLGELNQNAALSGYAGILWMLVVLKRKGTYEKGELDEYIHQFIDIVIEASEKDLKTENYDLLHGLMGKLLSLGRAKECISDQSRALAIENVINTGVKQILESATFLPNNQQVYWKSERLHADLVSIGFAHGHSSYIWFLSTICEEGQYYIESNTQRLIKEVVKQACNFLINRMSKNKGNSPLIRLQNFVSVNQIVDAPIKHTLSWSNGGLGASLALLKACYLLQDKEIEHFTLKLVSSLSKLKKKDANILWEGNSIDPGICHGTFGAFFTFYMLHRKLAIPALENAYKYWLDQGLKHMNYDEPFLGLKVCHVKYKNDMKYLEWHYRTGLLYGATGYGITLLTYYLLERGICIEDDLLWFRIFM